MNIFSTERNRALTDMFKIIYDALMHLLGRKEKCAVLSIRMTSPLGI
jgi:hypothetical protein